MKNRDVFQEDYTFPQTYNSYSEYKFNREQSEIRYLIHRKYLKMLGEFIETMYPGLKFDIHIRNRDLKERNPVWYGHTYMELAIFEVIGTPVYNPNTFEPIFRSIHCEEYINGERLFESIDSYIPDINKHLLITFHRCSDIPMNRMEYNMLDIPSFECWRHYYMRDSRKREMNRDRGHFI
jgi:hypothetical protein